MDKALTTMKRGEKCSVMCTKGYAFAAEHGPVNLEISLYEIYKETDVSFLKDKTIMKKEVKEAESGSVSQQIKDHPQFSVIQDKFYMQASRTPRLVEQVWVPILGASCSNKLFCRHLRPSQLKLSPTCVTCRDFDPPTKK